MIDEAGRRFMVDEHPDAELAPRDVVARAIHRILEAGGEAFLDARAAVGERFPERFPTVFQACRERGIDPRIEPMPVTPAAHYHMGGVATDVDGRTSRAGLWAVGEVASTGVHGANRLASNSLLEALVMGGRVAEAVRRRPATGSTEAVSLPEPEGTEAPNSEIEDRVRKLLWNRVGLIRDGRGLEETLAELRELERAPGAPRNLLTVARLVTAAAWAREESRGGHFRTDFPHADPAWERRLSVWLDPDGDERVVAGSPLTVHPRTAAVAGGRS